jgi:hypothetical protein
MKTPLIFSAAMLLLPSPCFAVITVQLSTADSPFHSGVSNQGWYSPSTPSHPSTDNYATGFFLGNNVETRGFLTFDLSSIAAQVTSARLEIRVGGTMSPDGDETVNVYAVSTDAAILNAKTSPAPAIFDDLGSGALLANNGVKTGQAADNRVPFEFSPLGLMEVNASRGGFFSVGLTVASLRPQRSHDEFVFTSSAGFPNFLELTLVPEPSAFVVAASSLLGLSVIRRRRRR